jgi:hypothetical protein
MLGKHVELEEIWEISKLLGFRSRVEEIIGVILKPKLFSHAEK